MEIYKIKNLTDKQDIFVREYLISLNGAEALRKAGYKTKRPEKYAHELRKNPDIAAAIEDGMKARAQRLEVAADNVVKELAKVAFFDLCRIVTIEKNGIKIKETENISADDRCALADIHDTTTRSGGYSRRVKAHDKLRALELLGRHLGMFTDRVETPGAPDSISIQYRRAKPEA